MQELINYFESLEARIVALEEAQQTNEAVIASLEAEVEELKNRPAPEPQVVEKIVEKIIEKQPEEPVIEKPVIEEQESAPVAEEPIAEEPIAEEPVVEETPEVVAEPEPVVEEPKKEPELFVEEEEPVAPKAMLYGKPVDDIRLAISLGDRFLYQRELFNQNAELMQRTLSDLNELGSFDEAMAYISKHFQWDTESNSYQQFLVTLHRRFG